MKKTDKSRSNSQKKRSESLQKTTELTNEDIDELITDITMKRPPNPYNLYIQDCWKEENKKGTGLTLIETGKKYHDNWTNGEIDQKKKDEYQRRHEELKEKYQRDIDIVKAILIDQFDNKGATAKRLFYNEREKEAVINGQTLEEAMEQAKEDWKNMTEEDLKYWEQKKKDNDTFWEVAEKTGKVNSYALFTKDKLEQWKKEGKKATFKDCAEEWKTLAKKKKLEYEKQAAEFNEIRERYAEMQKIKNGIMPTKPKGPFRLFLFEKSQEGTIKGKNYMQEAKKLYDNLSEAEKDVYVKRAHRQKLAYLYRKNIAKKNLKSKLPASKTLTPYNMYVQDLAKRKVVPKGENLMKYAADHWKSVGEKEKKKYEEEADLENEKRKKELKKYEGKIFEKPPKAKSAYQIYIQEKFAEETAEDFGSGNEAMTKFAEEWKKLNAKDKKKYEKKAEKEQKKVEKMNEEFKKKGYYTPIEGVGVKSKQSQRKAIAIAKDEDDDDEEEKEEKKTSKGKSVGKSKKSQSVKKSEGKQKEKGGKRKASASKGKSKGKNKK